MTPVVPGHLAALVGRSQAHALRGGAYVSAALSPALFFLCFYVPLRDTAPDHPGGFAQYVLPIVLLQSTMFIAITAAGDAAEESDGGMDRRLRTLPVRRWIPVSARMTVPLVAMTTSAAVTSLVAAAFGFRLRGDVLHGSAFLVLLLAFGLALSLGADALGTRIADEETTQQALLVPQLLLVMLSTGLVPASNYPTWIRGFVEHQPVSVLADALRAFTAGDTPGAAAWLWAAGLLVLCGGAAVIVQGRRR